MNIIETFNLSKIYGKIPAVDKVNMHIPEGSIYGFVGENGSGKTTIMRLLTGLAETSGGYFTINGVENSSSQIYEQRRNISAIVETTSLIPNMTALENIRFQELFLGIKQTDEERKELLRKVHLEDVGNKKVKNFSLGMRQRLGIALSLVNHPKLMLLDEPMNGLDPQGIVELRDLLIELNQKEHITVLISSHILSELEKIASHYGFISHGKLLEELTVEELQDKSRKSLMIKVEDVASIESILQSYPVSEYKVSPSGEIHVYDEVEIGDFVSHLHKNKVKILAIKSLDKSVEDYYLHLITKEGN